MKKKFIFLEHMADVKFKVFGKSLNEIFENSALAFSSYISSNSKIKPKKTKTIKLSADNKETLLYQFLDELIYLLDAENFAVSKAEVKITPNNKLTAKIKGDSANNYHLNHVKASTYAEMYIKILKNKNWEAQVVLDV